MNKECLKSFIKNVDNQLFEIVNNLICSICQELFNKPVTTPCGHSFCNGCIKRVLSSRTNSGCPLCKNSVKRYGLESDEVKSKLSEICKELPVAFQEDVKELTKDFLPLGEDLIKASKLSQLHNQECDKETKASRQKRTAVKKSKKASELAPSENDSESIYPVLKRAKFVMEYASAKKKRMDDLISISQTEPASDSSLGDPLEVNKKLEKIENIPPEEKIHEWFKAVGDNIFINSPGLSILETNSKNGSDDEKKEDEPKLLKRDKKESGVCSKKEVDAAKVAVDPYEFVPSQSSKTFDKKRHRKSTGKKISNFKALQSFSKENARQNTILKDACKEEVGSDKETNSPKKKKQITASQKFDQLLRETKKETKKPHALYLASHSSSPQFLDISFNSKVDSTENKKTPRARKKLINSEDILFKDVEILTGRKQERTSLRPKRKRSSNEVKSGKKQKMFLKMKAVESHEASEMEESMERDLMAENKLDFPPTKLAELLKELMEDDIIYATRPANAPVSLPETTVILENSKPAITQNTELIGFCTQEECTSEKNFKRLVENMEEELNLNEDFVEIQKAKADSHYSNEKIRTIDSIMSADENGNCEPKTWNESYVEFLHLGRLTPIRKRNKSTVVKVVFPIGLTSLARRRGLQTRNFIPAQVERGQIRHVSTGIQTSQQQTVSCKVQTSQLTRSSATIQTSQEIRPSVEIQTTQMCNASAGIQTSQMLVCQDIQTTQFECQAVQKQIKQSQLPQTDNSKSPQTLQRKPSHQHRKIIKRKKSNDSLFQSLSREVHPSAAKKEVSIDFQEEKESAKTWLSPQKHDNLVQLKNKKNEEHDKKLTNSRPNSVDLDSDDSNIQPPKRRNTLKILSQESVGIVENYETRQMIPLDVRKVAREDEMEVIHLGTPQNSQEQMLRVLKNIDLDLHMRKNITRSEKSEESDSDVFIEQTPPRPTSRASEVLTNTSRLGSAQKQPLKHENQESSEELDLIGDSVPKGFSESFLSASQTRLPISDKNPKKEILKMNLEIQTIDLPDENDQNQMNAFEDKTKLEAEEKTAQLKAMVDAWRRSDVAPLVKTVPQRRLCVVASSVKNPDQIKKFSTKFKIEYLSKPTKKMTHLIVGLHKNDEKEVLPLCTPKLLFAMANHKWVVSELWVEACLKSNTLLSEELFETLDPVGGCGCKKARLSGEKLLRNCEVFLLGEFQMISKEEFADLIVDCGGTLVPTPERFSFLPSKLRMIIADRDCLELDEKQLQDLYQMHSTAILSRDVIIMSIQSYRLANFFPYLLHSVSEKSLVKLGYPPSLVRNEEEEDGLSSAR